MILKEKIINYKIIAKKDFLSIELRDNQTIDETLDTIAKILSDGTGFIELCGNKVSDKVFLDTAKKTKQLCEMFGTTFAIKNRADIAYLSSADCVNLEQESVDIHSAREIVRENILIGFYMNNIIKSKLPPVKDGVDYVLIPNNISTPTEPVTSTGLEYAKWVSENSPIPVLILNNADRKPSPHSIGLTYSMIDTI